MICVHLKQAAKDGNTPKSWKSRITFEESHRRACMKQKSIILLSIILITGCSFQESTSFDLPDNQIEDTLTASPPCGDGVCAGPETAQNCPVDCQEHQGSLTDTGEGIPPLYFFYAIHVHGSDDFLPYSDPGMTSIDPVVAQNMIAAVEEISTTLEKYDIKGTWEFLPATVEGMVSYQGQDNILDQLLTTGHEIGTHGHNLTDIPAAVEALQDSIGISANTTSGFLAQISHTGLDEAQAAMAEAIALQVGLGLTVGTANLSPGGGKNPLSSACSNTIGIGNDMWLTTGNLMFPWRPDFLNKDICSHDPYGAMVLIDHVSIEWLILLEEAGPPDVLAEQHFNQLQGMFDAALHFMEGHRPERIAVWGFVTHIVEFAVGSKGENPPDPAALQALDNFLSYVDTKHQQGLVIYATASEIAQVFSLQNP